MSPNAVVIDLAARYGETNLTNAEVYGLGDALLSWMGSVVRLGHASPASTLDYTTGGYSDNIFSYVIRDFVAWTSGRLGLVPGCETRIRSYIESADLDRELSAKVDRLLKTGSAA